MSQKPEIVFTFPSCLGGVASFNYNIINYSKLIKGYKSKVVLLIVEEDERPAFTDTINADEVVTFRYSRNENQYKVQERLNAELGTGEGAIVADNSITVHAAVRFGNPKTIFYLLHDFFYVEQNIAMGNMADVCIAHSSFFSDAVYAANPDEFAGRSFYIPYGVSQLDAFPDKSDGKLNLVFLGRLVDSKGVMHLYEIDEHLKQKNVSVNWSVIGKGPLKNELLNQWKEKDNVQFLEPASVNDVYDILKKQDAFVFPTSFEGTPVSIIESLANGVVTITNDLPGGIRDIVQDGIGYRCELNNTAQFAGHIAYLDANRNELRKMQENCYSLAQDKYDISKNADDYFKCFGLYKEYKRTGKKKIPVLSRLDKEYLPDFLVKLIRSNR